MRLLNAIILAAALLAASDVIACRQLVKFDDHLSGEEAGWFKSYLLAKIVEVHPDRLVVEVARRFDGRAATSGALVLRFIPNQEAHAVCPMSFEAGQTYLIRIQVVDGQKQISRFNGYDIPAGHPKYPGYVQDLERASAANKSVERTRGE